MALRETNASPESVATRNRLLDAAERLFAEHGFRNASVRDITREAACNIASVNYHFGGKANLYREVFLRRLRDLRQRRMDGIQQAVEQGEYTLEELLRAFANAFVDPLVQEDDGRLWLMLSTHELVHPQLPPEVFHAEMILPLQVALGEAISRVCPALERERAELCAHSLVGQLLHVVRLQRCLPDTAEQPWQLPNLVEHTLQFSAAGIRTLPPLAN